MGLQKLIDEIESSKQNTKNSNAAINQQVQGQENAFRT